MTWAALRDSAVRRVAAAGLELPETLVRHWLADSFPHRSGPAPSVHQLEVAEAQLLRLLGGEPLAYVSGVAHFYGRRLEIRPGVLIPRPETEELVRWVLEHEDGSPKRFLDACTGSGCIAVTLAAERETWRGEAVDVSQTALAVTARNSRRLGVEERVAAEERDVLDLTAAIYRSARFNLLVSNPPYVPDADWARVQGSVKAFEPELALRVPDADPLLFYRALERLGRGALRAGGGLYFECNDLYVGEVARMLVGAGWLEVESLVDMQGRPRCVRGRRPSGEAPG